MVGPPMGPGGREGAEKVGFAGALRALRDPGLQNTNPREKSGGVPSEAGLKRVLLRNSIE